jgi:hypothetical protein
MVGWRRQRRLLAQPNAYGCARPKEHFVIKETRTLRKADIAYAALGALAPDDSVDNKVCDLIVNLLHLAGQEGMDVASLVRRCHDIYRDEVIDA